jgi:hypothetical protein
MTKDAQPFDGLILDSTDVRRIAKGFAWGMLLSAALWVSLAGTIWLFQRTQQTRFGLTHSARPSISIDPERPVLGLPLSPRS